MLCVCFASFFFNSLFGSIRFARNAIVEIFSIRFASVLIEFRFKFRNTLSPSLTLTHPYSLSFTSRVRVFSANFYYSYLSRVLLPLLLLLLLFITYPIPLNHVVYRRLFYIYVLVDTAYDFSSLRCTLSLFRLSRNFVVVVSAVIVSNRISHRWWWWEGNLNITWFSTRTQILLIHFYLKMWKLPKLCNFCLCIAWKFGPTEMKWEGKLCG